MRQPVVYLTLAIAALVVVLAAPRLRQYVTLRTILGVLVALLWTVAFYESWEALTHAAEAAKIPDPRPWPASVDGFILAMGLMVVEAKRTARGRAVWWPRIGMMAATALSTGIQVGYAPDDVGRGGAALAAWSPLAVYFAWECLVWLIFGSTSEDAAGSAASDTAGSAAEVRPDGRTGGRTDGRTLDAPSAVPVAAPMAASDTAGSAAAEPHSGRTDGRTLDAPAAVLAAASGAAGSAAVWTQPEPPPGRTSDTAERGHDTATTAAPVRPPTPAEVRKIEGQLGRSGGRKSARAINAATGIPEKVVRAYLATRQPPAEKVAATNGSGVPAE